MKSFWERKWSWWSAALLGIAAVAFVFRVPHQKEAPVAETLYHLVDMDPSLGSVDSARQVGPLVEDLLDSKGKPKNYRHTAQSLEGCGVTTIGMDGLRAFASGVFDAQNLGEVKALCPGRLQVMDLRQETHAFLNGYPVSWFEQHNWGNRGKPASQVEREELQAVASLKEKVGEQLYSYCVGPTVAKVEHDWIVERVETERELAERLGVDYQRFFVTDHYFASPIELDRFVSCLETQKADEWWYFHCRAGRGRSTTFMILYDSWVNAGEVSFADILLRQKLLGGRDLNELPAPDSYKYSQAVERREMAECFYRYCLYRKREGRLPWSKWLERSQL